MKYVYGFKLEKDEYEGFIVIEYINEKKNIIWTLDYLLNIDNSNKMTPFIKAKDWLKQNYPELMI